MPSTDPAEPVRVVDFDPASGVHDPDRLADLMATGLCDSRAEPAFDRLTALVADLIGVPIALLSLVDDHRQFFKSQQGLVEPTASARETPLSHSFCQYLVAVDTPLVIEDARRDPGLSTNDAIADLGVIAYAGFPVHGPAGEAIGSLCAIDTEPRTWKDQELSLLARLADVVSDLVAVRTTAKAADSRLATIHQLVDSQEQERGRVAAELHDDTLQVLSALSIRLQLLARGADEQTQEQIGILVEDLGGATRRIRRAVTDLRPDALGYEPLAQVVDEHLTWALVDHPDVTASVASDVTEEPESAAKVTLFRVAQQAVANALTHARPHRVQLQLSTVGAMTRLEVHDDGIGFDTAAPVPSGHYGLNIMRERAELAGGALSIHSTPGAGTTVIAMVPTTATT